MRPVRPPARYAGQPAAHSSSTTAPVCVAPGATGLDKAHPGVVLYKQWGRLRVCLDELPFAWATASPARSPVRPRWLAGSRRSSTTHAGSSSTAASFTRARRHALQLHPGPARSPGPASQLLDQLAGSTSPGMPKRPPVSSRSTITAPGQLAGLLVAPRPMYGHATSSQPANRCSTGQLHSIAGASFPGPPARLPGGQQLTRPASPGLNAGLVPHSRHRIGPGRAAS